MSDAADSVAQMCDSCRPVTIGWLAGAINIEDAEAVSRTR